MEILDYVVGLILLILVILAIRTMFFSKNTNCGSGCSNCPYSAQCHKEEKEKG